MPNHEHVALIKDKLEAANRKYDTVEGSADGIEFLKKFLKKFLRNS